MVRITLEFLFGVSLVAQMVKNMPACGQCGFDPWVRKIPWRRGWLSTPVFLPEEFHGQRSLVGYIQSTGLQRDTTEQLTRHHDLSWTKIPCRTEPACNAGDSGLIPGLGRSAGEGIGYPLQHSWASLVAQLVKNPPAMRET